MEVSNKLVTEKSLLYHFTSMSKAILLRFPVCTVCHMRIASSASNNEANRQRNGLIWERGCCHCPARTVFT
jgi:hypothetical protein